MSDQVIAAVEKVVEAGFCIRIRAGAIPSIIPQTIDIAVYQLYGRKKTLEVNCVLDLAESSARKHSVLASSILSCLDELTERVERLSPRNRLSLPVDHPPAPPEH